MSKFNFLAFLICLPLLVASGCQDDDASSRPILPSVSAPDISASAVSQTEGDGATTFEITVKLTNAFNEVVTVDYATRDRSAKAGKDYEAASGTVSFAVGETEKQISIKILTDAWEERDEDFEILLFNATNGMLLSDSVSVLAAGATTNWKTIPTAQPTLTWQMANSSLKPKKKALTGHSTPQPA